MVRRLTDLSAFSGLIFVQKFDRCSDGAESAKSLRYSETDGLESSAKLSSLMVWKGSRRSGVDNEESANGPGGVSCIAQDG